MIVRRASILEGRKDDCSTLMRAASVTIGNDIQPPKGCGQKLVDDKLSVLVDLKGLVDADAEIKKLQKELKTVEPLVAKLQAKIKDAQVFGEGAGEATVAGPGEAQGVRRQGGGGAWLL